MATKKKGKRHRGVVLLKPNASARTGWRARYLDPDKQAQGLAGAKAFRFESLPADLTTAEQRAHWAARKAEELTKRRVELATGALPETGTTLAKAVAAYFDAHPRLGERTVEDYRSAAAKLVAWGSSAGLKTCDELTRARLIEFRAALEREPKRGVLKGKKVGRGKRVATDQLRSPERVNTEMRKCGTVIRYLIDRALFPRLSHDDVRAAFKRLDVPRERIDFLRPAECQKLLEACLRHDADTMITREEEERLRREARARRISRKAMGAIQPGGTTPRYEPIAPFTAFVLLSGVRLGEALALDWSQVDLDALDSGGRKVGEIHLEGKTNKTKTYRTIDLAVSPALRSLLAAMKLATKGEGSVFRLSEGEAEAAAKRLKAEYGAPKSFGWQALRRTCATFLTCAPGIFGAASAYRSAAQLGHSVQVAQSNYLGLIKGISPDVRTLEEAMCIDRFLQQVIRLPGTVTPLLREVSR